ncbi:scavenger receptor class B member 1-like isoform X2 [Diorhabda carinulata]|uniref:scavenger receptor class B member 1-like isoform X2 n=1 Tax=Diorhabda carinulata TaxID=1163345 RepID=UPI0025A223CE|nr:scavenger receptor class B member 1-like isoform X2 [Diorhabda carinulata]
MKEIRYTVNKKILTLALVGVIMVCCSCLIYFYDPLNFIIQKLLSITPGSILFGLWADPPYTPALKFYIFNVTNSEQFLNGEEKLNITEVGPYCYREYLTNQNATFDIEKGTMTFRPHRNIVLDPECSARDPKKDRILVPNIPLLGIQSYLTDYNFLTSMAFSSLSLAMGSQSFVNITVDEYLWGYNDSLVAVANQFVPKWIDFDTFGIFQRLLSRDNANEVVVAVNPEKIESRYSNLLSEEERRAFFHIVKWNGLEGLPEWGYDGSDEAIKTTKKCQLVEGVYDGTFYPHPMKKTNINLFRKAFCRPITLEYFEEGYTKQGFKSYNYKMASNMFASPEENKENECFCHGGECPGKGLQTIAPCYYDIPITLSQPHFLNSPREIVDSVNGLEPKEEKHNSIAKMHPYLGIPLDESALKIQVNLGIKQTRFNSKTRPFNGLNVPILWIELSCTSLPSTVSFLITLVTDILPIGQKVLIYLLGILGLAFISGAALLTLFFTKTTIPRSLSIASEYSPVPVIHLPAKYFKDKEIKIRK